MTRKMKRAPNDDGNLSGDISPDARRPLRPRSGDPQPAGGCLYGLSRNPRSTPQKPGATMLVFPDGSQTGTLGGGCVEAEVKCRSLRLLDEGRPEIVTFHLERQLWLGRRPYLRWRMKMLVDPVRPGEDLAYYDVLSARVTEGKGFTEAVVLEPQASGGGAPADRWLVDENGTVVAQRGSATLPDGLLSNVKPLSQRPAGLRSGGRLVSSPPAPLPPW